MLREVPPGIEEEVKEAVWCCCTEVNAQSVQAGEVEGRGWDVVNFLRWIFYDKVCVGLHHQCIKSPRGEKTMLSQCVWICAFTPCLVSQILQYVIQYIFHMLALFLLMKHDSWWPLREQLCSTWWFVSCLSLLLLNFLFNNLITKESWWKTLFKVYMICPYHVFQHILLYYLYVFMYMLDNAKYVLDFLSHLYIIYII